MTAMEKVLIVGAGLTGAITASLLKQRLPSQTAVTIWEKLEQPGGRMSTSENPFDSQCTVDLGAQYISANPNFYDAHKRFYSELQKCRLLEPMTELIEDGPPDNRQQFITPKGSCSIVKYYIEQSHADVKYGQQIVNLNESGNEWIATSQTGVSDSFDCVILTLPITQILQVKGSVTDLINSLPDVKRKLTNVTYSSRFAMGLFYDPKTKINVPWSIKYINNDECVRYIAIDNKKRNQNDVGPSIVIHTSVPFGVKHLEEDKDKVCLEYVLPHTQKLFPDIPKPSAIINHKWRCSQIYKSYEGKPGAILISLSPLLLCGGDGFTVSGFDGCIESAETLVQKVIQQLNR